MDHRTKAKPWIYRTCKYPTCGTKFRTKNEIKEYCTRKCKSNNKNRTGLVVLYYLPEEHYVGITTRFKTRLTQHRKNGKITEGAEIIASFERAVDAALLELMFQVRGYNGFGGSISKSILTK